MKLKTNIPDDFNGYMKKTKPDTYTQPEKLICGWSDKKKYWIHYRMLKFCVRHGMEVVKVHTVISFKQSKWLEKYINLKTQKLNMAKNEFEKVFYKLLNIAFYGKTIENVRSWIKVEFIRKVVSDNFLKQ